MEIPLTGTKEKKRRFFRKTGSGGSSSSSSRGGGPGSWDSLQSPTTGHHSAMSSLTNSFENAAISETSLTAGTTLNNLNFPGTSTPPKNPHVNRSKLQGVPKSPGNSISLDEAEHILMQHRRLMTAPRRARSADRFDGMRINNSSRGEPLVQYSMLSRDELRSPNGSNKFNSPRPIRLCQGSGSSGGIGPILPNEIRRNQSASGIMSPPPPYQAAVKEKSGPPSYHQALVMASQKQKMSSGHSARPLTSVRHNNKPHHRGGVHSQSFDSEFGSSGTTMRSAISVPAFSNEVICTCSKCQIQNKYMMGAEDGNPEDYNDSAVYMESQAFLMQEIMTDGMAFCTIM